MQLFYAPDIHKDKYTFDEVESKHAVKVLRMKKGDTVHITDGKGNFYETEIIDPHPSECKVKIRNTITGYEDKGYFLHIAIAPTKNIKRFEWFLEKCTEIGIDEITPLICEHSERTTIRIERLEKVLIAAMKQSIKAYLPKLNSLTNYEQFLMEANEKVKTIAISDESKKNHLKDLCEDKNEILILIGPEGDFSGEEVELAKNKGFEPVSLGKSRLRTETAGVVACNIVNVVNE